MAAFLSSLLIFSFFSFGTSLTSNYYQKTCPAVESLVRKAVTDATKRDKTAPAGLLRMHFHDCFIRLKVLLMLIRVGFDDELKGCDGSVLLSSKSNNKAEKDGPPNLSLHAFYVVDNAKRAVESVCPGVVSCADILALAARDAVVVVSNHKNYANVFSLTFEPGVSLEAASLFLSGRGKAVYNLPSSYATLALLLVGFTEYDDDDDDDDFIWRSGGPSWIVLNGRKDGRISKASETIQLPAPTFNISQLQQSFSQRGLSLEDLAALSGNK
ncbi:putative peroxidase [Helianthus anomalus]